jgi:hypothetical protein
VPAAPVAPPFLRGHWPRGLLDHVALDEREQQPDGREHDDDGHTENTSTPVSVALGAAASLMVSFSGRR